MSNRRELLGFAAGAGVAAMLPSLAWSNSSFPSQPIRIVVAFGAGTGSDILARLIAPHMSAILRTPVIVENKLGGGGVVGTEYVVNAPPDGYTLTLGSTSSLGTTPLVNPTAKYRVDRDFAFVSGLAKSDYVIVTGTTPDSPKSLAELVARMKTQPTSYGSAGVGTISHFGSELFLQSTGTRSAHVPYKGSGQSIADVAAGHVLFASDSPAATLPMVRGGRLRILATTGPRRLAALPDVPTVSETFPDFTVLVWWGFAAPAATPPDIVRQLGDAVVKSLAVPEVQAQFRKMELEPMPLGPQEFTAFINTDTPFWTNFFRTSGIKLE